jgi:hypothetical protein
MARYDRAERAKRRARGVISQDRARARRSFKPQAGRNEMFDSQRTADTRKVRKCRARRPTHNAFATPP